MMADAVRPDDFIHAPLPAVEPVVLLHIAADGTRTIYASPAVVMVTVDRSGPERRVTRDILPPIPAVLASAAQSGLTARHGPCACTDRVDRWTNAWREAHGLPPLPARGVPA